MDEVLSYSYSSTRNVFKNNPVNMKQMINKEVEVKYDSKKIVGTVYTIDPVSNMVALMIKNKNNNIDMHLILGPHIESLKLIGPSEFIMEDIFKDKNVIELADEEKSCRRKKLKLWLQSNMIPIIEEGDILKLKDVLTIQPPYGFNDCVSENEIILEKIQNLIVAMNKQK
ncbi:gem-associated protein 6-like [Lycorma delicatula]|uniref:gem-associated protein 6-like n=1 Tax=Lycorma delicatula TaxID=130591 RepID=UPI003F50E3D4